MARLRTLPYRTIQDRRISTGHWVLNAANASIEDPARMEGWDYATDITVEKSLTADPLPELLEDCGLSSSAKIAAMICWHATGTKTRGVSTPRILTDGELGLRAELPGHELSGNLELRTRIVLVDSGGSVGSITASRRGSTLWEDKRPHRVALEGNLSRFPTTVVDFHNHPHFANDALWALGWDPDDLGRPTLGAICLYLNESHPGHKRLVAPQEGEELLNVLRLDVARQMLDGAMENSDFSTDDTHSEDTLGATLAQLQQLVFHGMSTSDVRELRRTRPSTYETTIQSFIRIGEA